MPVNRGWRRQESNLPLGTPSVEWTIPGSTVPGTYHIRHASKWRDTRWQFQDYEGQ